MKKQFPCGCIVDPKGSMPKILCAGCKAKLRPWHVVKPNAGTCWTSEGFQISNGLVHAGWFQSEKEAQRGADRRNADQESP